MLAVYAAAQSAFAALPAPLPDVALHLLDRLAPPAWTAEWYLPQWLGDAYAVPVEAIDALVLANVYGLGYIGLQDALIDAEAGDAERMVKQCLSTALFSLWLQQYLQWFPAGSPFWPHFNHFMQQWLIATLASTSPIKTDFQHFIGESYLQLAWRGAPLKICCVGVALLARRETALPHLLAAVDHHLTAAVLLDHEQDWRADLAAGRYNAFVHFASALPQNADIRETNRRHLLQKILLERATQPYFDLMQSHLQQAIANARAAGCAGLVSYLQRFSSEVIVHQSMVEANVTSLLRQSSQLLFGTI
jgi:hypothetical protein